MCSRVHKGVEIEQNCACHQEHTVLRACLSTLFFDRKCAVETKYSDLIGRDFNHRILFRRWLRSRPIRSGYLFSTSFLRSKKNVLRHALSKERHYCTKINAAELLVLAAACGVIFGRRSAGVLFAYLTLAHCACSPPWRQAHRDINDGQRRLFLPYITLLRRSHVCTQDRRGVLSTTPRDHSPLVRRQAG